MLLANMLSRVITKGAAVGKAAKAVPAAVTVISARRSFTTSHTALAGPPLEHPPLESHRKRRGYQGSSQRRAGPPPHLSTLGDLSPKQIENLLTVALTFKHICKNGSLLSIRSTLAGKTVALLFNKRSTRTRVASETSTQVLGGHPMFLGSQDVQLGVNESLEDSAKVIGSMVDGFMARVGDHSEIEAFIKHSPVPVINALSSLWHPTQILADLLTIHEMYHPEQKLSEIPPERAHSSVLKNVTKAVSPLEAVKGKKIVWVGDVNNVLNDMLVTYPRLGATMAVAAPKGYNEIDPRVWEYITKAGTESKIQLTTSPAEALKDADIVVTDTWISMGQEAEKADRLAAFAGYQVTEELVNSSGAKPDWKFMHCLPRKAEEVDDEVFHGPRSVVFQEAENRKWTIMACFDQIIGQWKL